MLETARLNGKSKNHIPSLTLKSKALLAAEMGMWRRLVAAVGVPALAAATLPSAIEKDDECQDETCALGALQLTGQKKVSEFVEAEEADAF
eukprot:s12_g1.t1